MTADFTDLELHRIREILTQRYNKAVSIQLADCEQVLNKNSELTTRCPTVFWHQAETNFVIFKAGTLYRGQFFYTPHEKYGTDLEEYSELDECIISLLETQSDHQREK